MHARPPGSHAGDDSNQTGTAIPHTRSVLLREHDYASLMKLLKNHDATVSTPLLDELDAATVVPDLELPSDVVAIGSVVAFHDLHSGQTSSVEVVFPHEADAARQRISILAPVGAALIGLRAGERITWPVPNGRQRSLKVIEVRRSARSVSGPRHDSFS